VGGKGFGGHDTVLLSLCVLLLVIITTTAVITTLLRITLCGTNEKYVAFIVVKLKGAAANEFAGLNGNLPTGDLGSSWERKKVHRLQLQSPLQLPLQAAPVAWRCCRSSQSYSSFELLPHYVGVRNIGTLVPLRGT